MKYLPCLFIIIALSSIFCQEEEIRETLRQYKALIESSIHFDKNFTKIVKYYSTDTDLKVDLITKDSLRQNIILLNNKKKQ